MTPSDHREYKCYAIFMLQFWMLGASVGGEEYDLRMIQLPAWEMGQTVMGRSLFYFQVVIYLGFLDILHGFDHACTPWAIFLISWTPITWSGLYKLLFQNGFLLKHVRNSWLFIQLFLYVVAIAISLMSPIAHTARSLYWPFSCFVTRVNFFGL